MEVPKGSALHVWSTKPSQRAETLLPCTLRRTKTYLLSYVIQLRKSYTILFPSPTSQLHHKFKTTIKTRRTDPGGRNQSTTLSHKISKASKIWKGKSLEKEICNVQYL